MLLAAFERVERDPKVRYAYPAEEAWIVNRLFYWAVPNATAGVSGRPERPPFAELFRRNGEKYFGITFETTGAARPTSDDLGRSGQSTIQRLSEDNDVLIDSSVHLATSWSGNTFSMSKPFTGSFHTAAGIEQQVQMLKSELSVYRHAKTPVFEAVVLPCHRGYMVAILPAPGVQIADLGRAIAESPDTLDAELKPEIGQVTMPPFHTKVEWDLTPYLKQMGIQQAFKDLGRLFDIPRSRLTHVAQTVDIQIDQSGIRADAGTVVGAIYGGVMGGQLQPFSMTLDRPFIFLVRERISDALLFVGTVMDPTPQ
jgi:serine protease inhibitor